MKQKLNCVLLVDDDLATNFLHRKIIEKMNVAEHIEVARNGREALDYLTNSGKHESTSQQFPQPQLLFLDINMPVMNGWEFLEEYDKLNDNQKCEVVIMMLTTSNNPDDKNKAEQMPHVAEFQHKPLTIQIVNNVLEKYFPDYA